MRVLSPCAALLVTLLGTPVSAQPSAEGADWQESPEEVSPSAEEATPAAARLPDVEPAPPPNPPAQVAPVSPPPPMAVPEDYACVVVPGPGVHAAATHTVAGIVCDELRGRGISIGRPVLAAAPGQPSYLVQIERLGAKAILRVSQLNGSGAVVRSQRVVLNHVDESVQAAPRLAESLVSGKPFDDTARMKNLIGEETRRYSKKRGETLWGLGIVGYTLPGESFTGTGLHMPIFYETPQWGVGVDFRYAGMGGDDERDSSYGAISVGGRYFFSDTDFAPFLGLGAAMSWLDVSHDETNGDYEYDDSYSYDGSGLAAYGELGIEALRLHGVRLNAALRVDVPFYDLERSDSYAASRALTKKPGSMHRVPVMLNVSLLW